jgi:pimeloyl-ACP methyl ester carboxylesterase
MDVFDGAEVVELRPGRYIRVLHLKAEGTATARLLFCHGSMASMVQYRSCIEYVRNRGDCDILAYDWLGCGGSEKPRDWESYSTPELLLDLEAAYCYLLKGGCRATPTILVGHSFGASLVTQLDAEVRSALANDIFECSDGNDSALLPAPAALCCISTSDGEGLGGQLAVFYLPEFGLKMLQPSMTSAFAKMALHPTTDERVQREALATSEANEMHVCKAFYRQIQWREPETAKCAGPALCLHGDSDGVIPMEQGRRAASQFDQAAFHVIHKASHQVMEEQPEATVALLGRLVDNVIAGGDVLEGFDKL